MPNLIYGVTYSIQNGYNNWGGGYLDTCADAKCASETVYAVSTANTPQRDDSSGLWIIESAEGKKDGLPVNCNDKIHLRNLYGKGTYLDTCGTGCEGNFLCVSTATTNNRDNGSGTWIIIPDQCDTGVIAEGTVVRLLNCYNLSAGDGGFLDTRGKSTACPDTDLLSVSTSATYNRDSGSTTWRFKSTF